MLPVKISYIKKYFFHCRKNAATFFLPLLCMVMVAGCDRREEASPPASDARMSLAATGTGCERCHPNTLDEVHNLDCTTCHAGNPEGISAEEAHTGMVAQPAHPDNMEKVCGPCHGEQVHHAAGSLHFTLANEVNMVRTAFGANKKISSLLAIPVVDPPVTALDLADDLLRRRCLRCHVYTPGDSYADTRHGTGCAACHLSFQDGEMQSHSFIRYPEDRQCLACHYGNHVGADYYGRFEHDYKWEYRTPYGIDGSYPDRPYGVEYHQLAPDIHRQAGIACIDCHSGAELKGAAKKVTCEMCHQDGAEQQWPEVNVIRKNNTLYLLTKTDGRQLKIPSLHHPAHTKYRDKADCTVCHAQWTMNDKGLHLLRQDHEDYEPWSLLSVQGSWEVEYILETTLSGARNIPPLMTDKISGVTRPGIWYKGFELRRWEFPLIGRDSDGRLKTFRPLLDMHLSYSNEDEEVIFDSVPVINKKSEYQPYTPHTIGKAGIYYRKRLNENLPR